MPNDLSLRDKLNETAAAGFDYLEMSIDESDEKLARLDWKASEITELVSAINETGVQVKSFCLSGHRRFPLGSCDEATRNKGLEIMSKAITLASKLGVSIIQLAGYDVYYEQSSDETENYFKENLAKSVEMAANEGVYLGFETMETPFLDTVRKAMRWVKLINSPYLHVYPDIGNLTNAAKLYGVDPAEDFQSGAGHMLAVHLKETKPNVYREVPYGTGHVDFNAMVEHSLRLGVRMFVGEFWYTGEDDWRKTLRHNCDFLRNIINYKQ